MFMASASDPLFSPLSETKEDYFGDAFSSGILLDSGS